MSVFSRSGSFSNPSAYTCTTAASPTFSRRYLRVGVVCVGVVVVSDGVAADFEQLVDIIVSTHSRRT